MPPHIEYRTTAGALAGPIVITGLSGGEESAVTTLDIWNDKNDTYIDTESSIDQFLKILLSSTGAPYVDTGVPLIDERWSVVRIIGTVTAAGFSTDGAGSSQAVGTNSEFSLPDLEPQTGVRVEFKVVAPAGATANALKIKLRTVGNVASAPLAKYVGLASGSGVLPGDRVAGLRAIVRGSVVTANDTATVTVSRGSMVYDGAAVTFLQDSETFTLADGDAVNLGSNEAYNVTLSRTSAGAIVATKGPKAEAVLFPAIPAGNVIVARLTVESADGVAVTVAQSSVDQSEVLYHEFLVRDGGGLSVLVSPGEGITETGFRQPSSRETSVSIDASSTSRIWRLAAGSKVATLTDVPPEYGADLLALVTADVSAVTSIVDARRFVHRALTTDRIELHYQAVLTGVGAPAHGLALAYAYDDFEIEEVELNLSNKDAGWTGGAIKVDVLTLAPGAAAPFPAGGAGGTTIFTGSGTDDRRPSIAHNAASLRAVSVDHEVRRIVKGARLLLSVIATVTGPGGEPQQEIRVALHVRRYR